MTNWLLPLIPFLLFFAFLPWGTQRRVNCPQCGARLPVLQSPWTKSRRQWMEGGYRCQRCGCETNLAGEPVSPEQRVPPGQPVSRNSRSV